MVSRRSLLRAFGLAVPGITVLEGLRRAGSSLGFDSQNGQKQDESAFFRKGWERDLGAYRLPDWFTSNRVQAHTGLSLKWLGRREFSQAPAIVADLGAHVLTRYIKTGDEDPWWPTATMTSANSNSLADQALLVRGTALRRDLVRRMIEDTHAQGLRFIAYYWHMADATASRLHPEWVCRGPGGRIIRHRRRGNHLDITSAYREVTLQRLLELGALGVDGIYFDERHLPDDGCWRTELAQGFRDETGSDPPRQKDENDPLYCSFLDYQAYRVEETFAYWRREVHARYPELVFIISTAVVPALVNRRMTTNLVRLADSSKNEFYSAISSRFNLRISPKNRDLPQPRRDIRMALGWTLLRDSAEGRPPHIWAPGFVTPRETLAATAGVLTYGGIMNINIYESHLKPTQPRSIEKRESARHAFALGNLISPYLKGTTPLRWGAVHWSELARNRRHGHLARAWRELLWPINEAFAEFVEQGVPVGTVDDFQLENDRLDDYRILFLATPRELTRRQQEAVDRFKVSGGAVIEPDPAWRWDDPNTRAAARRALRAFIEPHLRTTPIQVELPGAKIHAGMFRNDITGNVVVPVTNDFSWVRIRRGRAKRPGSVTPPPPISGVNLFVRAQHPPTRVHDILAGTDLNFELVAGQIRIRVPTFDTFAVVNIEFG